MVKAARARCVIICEELERDSLMIEIGIDKNRSLGRKGDY